MSDANVSVLLILLLGFTGIYGLNLCDDGNDNSLTSIGISLQKLQGYPGTCVCIVQSPNNAAKTIISPNIDLPCNMTLDIDDFQHEYDCNSKQQPNISMILALQESFNITLRVRGYYSPVNVSGRLHFDSNVTITASCHGSNFVITSTPGPTTPPTTPIPKTTPEPEVVPLLLSAASGVFGGFVVLMLLMALCIWDRERRKKNHDAKQAAAEGAIPYPDREHTDPEMVKYSWFRTLSIRLKRLYYGEPKNKRRSRYSGGAGARSRSLAKEQSGPTGTEARKRLQRLFKKRSSRSNSSNSLKQSIAETTSDTDGAPKEEASAKSEEVFHDVPLQHGGGLFMDARRESPEDDSKLENGYASVTIHSNNRPGSYDGKGILRRSSEVENKEEKSNAQGPEGQSGNQKNRALKKMLQNNSNYVNVEKAPRSRSSVNDEDDDVDNVSLNSAGEYVNKELSAEMDAVDHLYSTVNRSK